jgi:hypothetical protein
VSFPDAERTRFSPAGEMEAMSDFARGANANPRKQRLVRIMLYVAFVILALPLLIGLIVWLLG